MTLMNGMLKCHFSKKLDRGSRKHDINGWCATINRFISLERYNLSTKVFISWSGDLSCQLAGAIRNWLPGVLQYVQPYFTPDDIEKGTKWSTEIIGELEASEVGIICLTRENLNNPWILFEAGALSKNFGKSKVCTILFGIDSSDLTGPLTGFQDTKFNKTDFKKLGLSQITRHYTF